MALKLWRVSACRFLGLHPEFLIQEGGGGAGEYAFTASSQKIPVLPVQEPLLEAEGTDSKGFEAGKSLVASRTRKESGMAGG